ncbi:SIP domain-containing protein [Stenotrophomonas sp. 24(2023)]|uniref:siderophore-interacting protein n=1 Tax=Stenotrophomonas sp. 24(2023) TaxID=3068324 RepID=UPI0027DFF632|nr:SIP domain-containing protein [Stenotrophomonas sp. 24(2023)]WMJ68922.1 SIP domain-containing protein [Stenotrophomonas sp. 24(2023)]
MSRSPLDAPAAPPGRISRTLIRLLMKQARITAVDRIGRHARVLTLESEAFREVAWQPGQKLQVAMGSAFVARTYTPMTWDAAVGRTQLLGFSHGGGPGSAWLLGAVAGDACHVFGPRPAVDPGRTGAVCVLVGDETSIALAQALARHGTVPVQCLLEVDDAQSAHAVLGHLGLTGVEVHARQPHEAHWAAMEPRLRALAGSDATFVLTGKAATVQHLRRVLKALGVATARIAAKPHWAPGRTGMD